MHDMINLIIYELCTKYLFCLVFEKDFNFHRAIYIYLSLQIEIIFGPMNRLGPTVPSICTCLSICLSALKIPLGPYIVVFGVTNRGANQNLRTVASIDFFIFILLHMGKRGLKNLLDDRLI